MASILGTSATILASLAFMGLRTSFSEIRIRPEYVPFVTSILSAVVGLAMIFILARAFYKKRVLWRAGLTKNIRAQEKRLFELAELDFDAIVGAHGRR